MQAASRESYAAAAERLDAYARGAEPTAVASTGDELLAVGRLLRDQPRLRRAVSDPARTGADRAAMLTDLLSGKIGSDANELVRALVSGRWSTSVDLLEGIERLGVEALLASADAADELGEVEDELFRFGQVVSGDPRLASVLADVIAPARQRAELARNLLEGKARPVTIRLVEVALAGFGGRSFDGALSRLVELAAARRDQQVAYVTVAAALSEAEEQRLGARLSALYGREVTVMQAVDPAILGGMSVRIGADLYDGTVLRRLTETRNALTKR
ncbi:F0F1 ATP synthase subunit delta [Plantactinospora sp. KBS50]|uniref:F0F1 ATP synthase subunit delta n=1 Tax=Plantactinospora sp. KBS50 TaxID=2024580 RepID=UPI000BAAB3E7|nr:F0F1 ATP synthase subunit delta [Plantactinospora sp. KBS50]ASW56452.1 F0F1 ATP synthase subunit delta [Plantactinospora sp. KBS50]